MAEGQLSLSEARVLASLVEKSITTPQYYPMTVNGIRTACNQKSCRSPAMNLTEGEVGAALNSLLEQRLVDRDDVGGRAPKWRQQMRAQLLLKRDTQAVLVTLMLRGPQTLAELLRNAATLQGPDTPEGLTGALDDLSDRAEPMVVQLARAPGQKEARFVHCLCGEPQTATEEFDPASAATSLAQSVRSSGTALEQRVTTLEARLARLEAELGVSPAEPDA